MPDSAHAENLIRLGDYYPKLNFGFASAFLGLKGDLFTECSDRAGFSALEILPDQFHSASEDQKRKWRKRFKVIHCGSLLDGVVTSMLPDAGPALCRDFLRTAERLLEQLQQDSIPAGIMDFSLDGVLHNESKKKNLQQLLRTLHPVLQRTDRTLLLPLHVPTAAEDTVALVQQFLREMMIRHLKICLIITPHELKKDISPRSLAGLLRFETGQVRFCYNADSGNVLLRAHLVPWLRYFSLTGFKGPILFCPYSRENRLASLQSSACSLLAEELVKSE